MKSDFVSTVSHELRTPLTSIYGFAETLLRRDIAFCDAERATFLGYIASESERLTRDRRRAARTSRGSTRGDLQVELAPTDVGAVARRPSRPRAPALDERPPLRGRRSTTSGLEVQADPDKLRQVVDQLVENAVKYSPAGGTVRIEARARGRRGRDHRRRRGHRHPRLATASGSSTSSTAAASTSPGTGLGLFIAQGLVSAMGGKIWVDSEEGRGSRFTFELPVRGRAT